MSFIIFLCLGIAYGLYSYGTSRSEKPTNTKGYAHFDDSSYTMHWLLFVLKGIGISIFVYVMYAIGWR
jgi:hypothetical protein